MGMEDTIQRFGEQFAWEPAVVRGETLGVHKNYIVAGMGGSHLGAWLIKRYGNVSNITIHRDYGLPNIPPDLQDVCVILSSFSGNTEEILDAGQRAYEKRLPMVAIATGGKLLEFAREHTLPAVEIPQTGLEPRMAIGFSMLGLARLMMNKPLEDAIRTGGKAVNPTAGQTEGKRLAGVLAGKIPLIYSSAANIPLAYIWKIKFNETAKIPAFCDSFPEMCHNELTGFDVVPSTRDISAKMHAIFLEDFGDDPRVRGRMKVAAEMLAERGIPVEHVALAGKTAFEKAFNGALLADWISMGLADSYGVPNPETPMVAEFKKRIGQ